LKSLKKIDSKYVRAESIHNNLFSSLLLLSHPRLRQGGPHSSLGELHPGTAPLKAMQLPPCQESSRPVRPLWAHKGTQNSPNSGLCFFLSTEKSHIRRALF